MPKFPSFFLSQYGGNLFEKKEVLNFFPQGMLTYISLVVSYSGKNVDHSE